MVETFEKKGAEAQTWAWHLLFLGVGVALVAAGLV